jgi:hypothetical protein
LTAALAAVLLLLIAFTSCGVFGLPEKEATALPTEPAAETPVVTELSDADTPDPAATPTAEPDSGYGPEFWQEAEALLPYYKEVALGAEHGTVDGKVHKWVRPILLYVRPSPDAEKYEYYIQELIARFEAIPGFPGVTRVVNVEAAELTLEFVTAAEMNEITGQYNDPAFGYAHVSWYNSSSVLFSGSIFIVREAESSEADVLHALTEEFTQALGLLNDSYKYPDSIFYQGYSVVTEFSLEDLTVLKLHYAVEISAGMEYDDISAIVTRKAHGTD